MSILEVQPTEENPILIHDYPYSFKRTDIRYWVESKKKKGDRFCSQTLNPKTHEWNKPKKSTYAAVMVVYLDEKEHITYKSTWRSTSAEDYKNFMEFIGDLELNDLQKDELRLIRAYIKAYSGVTYSVSSGLSEEEREEHEKEQDKIQNQINNRVAVNYRNDEGCL